MAFTRFKYDDSRTIKSLQQSTDPGRWVLNVPGNGDKPCYMEDPHIIPQKWAGNLRTNIVDLESSLRGVNRHLSRDCLGKNEYNNYNVNNQAIQYPTSSQLTTEQSRTTNPAWWYRDLEQNNFEYPFLDPQANVCFSFENNLSTRILEKDYYTPKRDCVLDETKQMLPSSYNLIRGGYTGGPTICTQTNSCQNI